MIFYISGVKINFKRNLFANSGIRKQVGFLLLCMPARLIAVPLCSQPVNNQNQGAAVLTYTRSNVINLSNAHDLIIKGKAISGGSTAAIYLFNCSNIHITQNKLYNSTDVGIHLVNCKNITIDYNYFTNVSTGVYAEQIAGGGIIVNNNQFLDMKGPFPRGQFVQFNKVSGANNSISYNKCENIAGESFPEDGISLYKSNGTPASAILVKGNWIRGGGPSSSGGGIMLGDNGGSYLMATDNILVDPGQYGMAISGGDHNTIVNNTIYGRSQHFSNVGLYVAGMSGFSCKNSIVKGNKIRYLNSKNYENDSWLGPNADAPAGWHSNVFGAGISASVLPKVIITYK
jgi:parallel beta-helix repeat protein